MQTIKIINRKSTLIHGHSFIATNKCKVVSSVKDINVANLDSIIWYLDIDSLCDFTEIFAYYKKLNIRQTLYVDQAFLGIDLLPQNEIFNKFDGYIFVIDTLNDAVAKNIGYPDNYTDFILQHIKKCPNSAITSYISNNNLYFFAGINDLVRNFGVKIWEIVNIKSLIDSNVLSRDGLFWENKDIDDYIIKIASSPEEIIPQTVTVNCVTAQTHCNLGDVYFIK